MFAVVITLGACGGDSDAERVVPAPWKPDPGSELRGVPLASVTLAIRTRVAGDERPQAIDERQWKRVRQLYETYDDSPLWFEEDGLSERARLLVRALNDAHSEGLGLASYPLNELLDKLTAVTTTDTASAEQFAAADIVLTSTFIDLSEDLLTGQVDPRTVSKGWHIDPRQVDVDSAVARALGTENFEDALAALRPQEPTYQMLRNELAHYRDLAAAGFPEVPEGKSLRPGDRASADRLNALRARLSAEGYANVDNAPDSAIGGGNTQYDHDLAALVATFQARHNLVVDSVLGKQTVASLNLPASYRAGQIAANMERFRWLPGTLGSRYVLVNVPAFHVQAYDSGRVVLEMKVVVGAEYDGRSTPVFSDSMSSVVFRPYWNVPASIARNEIYPKAAADPGYMERHHYEVVTRNGYTYVRQKPGADNSLGLVKFLFPNEFAIYLHDTPNSSAFAQDVRAISHGCIRLEHPSEFAQWVLGWDEARVDQAMHSGPDDHEVTLEQKIPVYIVYFTTYVRDGQLWFGNDLYQRDSALVNRMSQGAEAEVGARSTAAALEKLVTEGSRSAAAGTHTPQTSPYRRSASTTPDRET